MAKSNKYVQCLLVKSVPGVGYRNDVAFIPIEFAILNKCLKIEDDNGWIVKAIYKDSIRTIDDLNNQRNTQKTYEWVLGNEE